MTDIAFDPALNLAARIRAKEISAAELLAHYLDRIERHNPSLNAIIWTQIEQATEKARAADAALARGEKLGPLHGVPMTVKESYDWVGSPSTWGVPKMRDRFPEADSVAIGRLQAAGAIVFGKTNVPSKLSDWQSFNEIYGTTNNPWDVSRTPGGSSGGSAAALAAGMTGLEIGSDIGASIRNPAHYCGVFGHKPTFSIVPCVGQEMPGQFEEKDIAVCGPLARSAEDLAVSLDILAGPAGRRAVGWRLDLPPPRHTELRDIRAAVMLQSPACAQDDKLTAQLTVTVEALAKAGMQVDWQPELPVDPVRAQHVYLLLLRCATGTRLDDATYAQHQRDAAARAADDWSHYRAYVDRGITLTYRDWAALDNERLNMCADWAAFFTRYDVLLCPTAASTAFPHDQAGERADRTIPVNGKPEPTTDQLFWAGYPGMVYLPSTVVPAGLASDGLPCGLQIVAGHLEDKTSIETARLIAEVTGGFAPPPGYD